MALRSNQTRRLDRVELFGGVESYGRGGLLNAVGFPCRAGSVCGAEMSKVRASAEVRRAEKIVAGILYTAWILAAGISIHLTRGRVSKGLVLILTENR
jgi:hypothetical protein